MDNTDAFLALSPDGFNAFITTSPPPPIFATQDFAFAQVLETPNTPSLSLSFPQASQEYPPLMSPELMQLFGASEIIPAARVPQITPSQDIASNPASLAFTPDLLAQAAVASYSLMMNSLHPAHPHLHPHSSMMQSHLNVNPHLDIKAEPNEAPWLSYMQEVLSHPLPFQSSLATISPRDGTTTNTTTPCGNSQGMTFQAVAGAGGNMTMNMNMNIKQEATAQSSALQKLHQRLLQRLRKSQQDCPPGGALDEQDDPLPSLLDPPAQLVVSESSKKADSSFNKVLELFSYYFNTQKTASPLACTAALYLGQVGFELQKRYEAYSRYIKCGVLEEMLVSITRAANLRKLGIKSYEEFLRAEVSELRRIKDPERYLNRRMQVFQSYEPEELEGVYLSFDALYLLAKKPPSFRKEWLEEGKVRIVHICEIHEAWRSSPLNKTKRSRTPELEETSDACVPKGKVLKVEH